jgi:hypothetical protein
MARDYVTFREHTDDAGNTTWTFENVGPFRLKSAPAHVVRNGNSYRIIGVAWGGPIDSVEVSVDGGGWQLAELTEARRSRSGGGLAWRFWTLDWGTPAAGQHTITSRAISRDGQVQPAPTDPIIADKRTYWESNGQITRTVMI